MDTTAKGTPYASGDRCLLRTIDGQPCAVHYYCDDYPNGTVTSIITGKIIRTRQALEGAAHDAIEGV